MSKVTAPGQPEVRPAPASGRRRWVPFWVLQLTELVVAFIFVDISVHVGHSGLLVAAAVTFAVLAVTAHGPLGIFRICPPWLHLTLLISVAAVVAVAPVLPGLRPDIEGIIVIEFGAIGLIRLATLTDLHPAPRSRGSSGAPRPDATIIDATATARTTAAAATSTTGAGRADTPGSPTGAAARWAGRAAGVAAVSGRRAVAKHGPEAEAQVKRALRGAGRWTGRLTSPGGSTGRTTDGAPGRTTDGATGSGTDGTTDR